MLSTPEARIRTYLDYARANGICVPRPADESEINTLASTVSNYSLGELRLLFLETRGPVRTDTRILSASSDPSERSSVAGVMSRHVDWASYPWVPVASDGFGNYYVVDLSHNTPSGGNPVVFVDKSVSSTEPAYLVASSLSYFLEFVRLQHDLPEDVKDGVIEIPFWPFDRKFVISVDPEFESIREYPIPWAL